MTATGSREYWRKREEANLKGELLKEKAYTKALSDIYSDMMDSIQKEIDAFYTRYASKEGITYSEAVKRASKLDIEAYARKAKKYIKEHDLSPTANAEMRLYNLTMKANRLEVLKAEIGAELTRCFNDIEGECRYALNERTQEELERQAGILGDTVHDNEKAANAIVNASFKNATFSDRIWMHQDILKGELNNLLSQGLIQGKHPSVLARDLRKRVDVSKHDAERLLRTELCRVQIEAQKQSYERNGYDEYEFIALEGHACSVCSALDGQHFKVQDMVHAENAPPMHPNCRCSTAAWVDSKAFGEDAKVNNGIDAFHTYEDPIREKIGPAYKSHPKELSSLKKKIKGKGVEIVERKGVMAYQGTGTIGKPGRLVMDPEASYSAWLHEYRHLLDDEASGWKGSLLMADVDTFAKMEDRAYDVEIDFARNLGYDKIVKRLEWLKGERRREVYGKKVRRKGNSTGFVR